MGRPSEGWVKRGCSRIRIEQKQKKQRQDVENDSICTGIGQPCVILGGTFIAWHPPTFRRSFVRYLHSLPRQNVVHFDEKGRKITKKQGGLFWNIGGKPKELITFLMQCTANGVVVNSRI